MPKQIIILERLGEPSDLQYRFVLWAAVPASRAVGYANPEATSSYKDATPEELAAIKAGAVVEQAGTVIYAIGTDFAVIEVDLIAQFAAFQEHINTANPTSQYGTYWDGNAWHAAGTL